MYHWSFLRARGQIKNGGWSSRPVALQQRHVPPAGRGQPTGSTNLSSQKTLHILYPKD